VKRGMQQRTIEKRKQWAANVDADARELGLSVRWSGPEDGIDIFRLFRDGKEVETFVEVGRIYTWLNGYRNGFEQAQQERRELAAKQQS
jgi:hypothetical protein